MRAINAIRYPRIFALFSLTLLSVAQAATLTVADIAARNATARGGLSAWRAVNSMVVAGEMDAGGQQEARLPFVWSMKRPNKSRLELVFQEKTAVQVYDGVQGFKYRPFLNREDIEPYTQAEQQSAAAAAELDGPLLDYARKGTRLQLEGTEAVEGRKAYRLLLTPKVGPKVHVWIDAADFLEKKMDGEPRRLNGSVHTVSIYLRDYRKENGLTVAHTLETVVAGVKQTHKISINSVKFNPPLQDAQFVLKPNAGFSKASLETSH